MPASAPASTSTPAVQRILFVGDSFTHGRYTPVRPYNSGGTLDPINGSALVYDENFDATSRKRQESKAESGPWGGIPGIFAEFAFETGLNYDVHIEAISETSLINNYTAAKDVIDQSKWNAVVLQELSAKPIPAVLSLKPTISHPSDFCNNIITIEGGIHQASPAANVYLYETWASADNAQALTGSVTGAPETSSYQAQYLTNLGLLGDAVHNAYYSAARGDGHIAAVAPAGDAWRRAWAENVANPDPAATSSLPLLWYNFNSVNNPSISSPDLHHPSIYGAYLSGLVLFQQITGVDPRKLGPDEKAASQLGVPSTVAVQLQQIAWETVTQENPAPIDQTLDPCTVAN